MEVSGGGKTELHAAGESFQVPKTVGAGIAADGADPQDSYQREVGSAPDVE